MFREQFSLEVSASRQSEIPLTGIRRIFFIIKTFFIRIIILNLMFLLFSIPIVTIPAAYCAMNKVLFNLLREGSCFLWHDFINEFKSCFIKSLGLGLIWATIFAGFLLIYSLYDIGNVIGYTLNAIAIIIVLNIGIIMNYSFAMLSLVNLKLKDLLKDSFIFLLTQYRRNLVLLIFPNAVMFACFYFFPLTIPILVFGAFSFTQLIICEIVLRPISTHVIR